jgi:hypothetical protein
MPKNPSDWLTIEWAVAGIIITVLFTVYAVSPRIQYFVRTWSYITGQSRARRFTVLLVLWLITCIVCMSCFVTPDEVLAIHRVHLQPNVEILIHSWWVFPFAGVTWALLFMCLLDLIWGGRIFARVAPKINILAWVGWEVLEWRSPHNPGTFLMRVQTLYYNRGISTDTTVYTGMREGFHIELLDAERLATENVDEQNRALAQLHADNHEIVQNIFDNSKMNSDVAKYGVPVRFGFNEIIYSSNCSVFKNIKGRSITELKLSGLRQKWLADHNKNLPFTILLWDWYLPTMATLLAIYASKEDLRDDCGHHTINQVFDFSKEQVEKISEKIKADFEALSDDEKYGPVIFKKAQDVRVMQRAIQDNIRDIKIKEKFLIALGSGSTAVGAKENTGVSAFHPQEGILTWVELASLVKAHRDNPTAINVIGSLLLSDSTQRELLSSNSIAPYGLPTRKESLQRVFQFNGARLAAETAKYAWEEIKKERPTPLVLRRIPKCRDIWEEKWLDISKDISLLDSSG